MFGYVLPRKDKLSEEEFRRYRAAYCGLCHCLKQNYGFFGRFLVNYDMTFLYFLLKSGEKEDPLRCFCPARPFCRKDCLPQDAAMDYAADMSVLLSFWKLRDAERDGKLLHRAAAKLVMRLYRRSYRTAARRQPEADRLFGTQLELLHRLEEERCPSIDRTADAFACLLKGCAAFFEDGTERRVAEQLLYHVGRFLYLADALDDLPGDLKSGGYNPLLYRYTLRGGALDGKDKAQLLESIDASIGLAASALELLSPRADGAILTNIIYYGLPAVLHSVAEGTFRKRSKK